MFDLFLTLALVYFGYRAFNWYSRMQQQVRGGQPGSERVDGQQQQPQPHEEDYIDYEELE